MRLAEVGLRGGAQRSENGVDADVGDGAVDPSDVGDEVRQSLQVFSPRRMLRVPGERRRIGLQQVARRGGS